MNNCNVKAFNKIYISFCTILLLLCSFFMAFTLYFDIMAKNKVILISTLFIISIFIIGILFIYIIRKKVVEIINSLDNIVTNAINEENIVTGYEETILSSLENKIHRYIKINKSNKKSIENERNNVKSLVADISHQTKTPISNILLYSQLILENESIDEYTKDILKDIKNQSERLNFLIQSLIKMSRLESNIISLKQSKTKIINVLTKSVQEVYHDADKKQLDIKVDCSEDITSNIDIKWTVEAIVNILENSIKYTNAKGRIEICVTSYELFRRIDIKDTGIGICESEINNIFKRFYRCKNVVNYEGVGIGLYLSRQIVSLQGGYIKVSSKVNEGSTFSIFLPS
ncbi:sensor histidine kinase [[Clostridium] dakarense]|uniref:sensor histidine kinase n=1 Tax=Faecalimicrobium dakarense TaxID=1301100 RepID=UPI0004B8D04A|nr:HAMP domain-containing sensor histidine kinase [[Clostridium] dakarense]